MALKGFPITFNIYATDEAEAEEARRAFIGFINAHAAQGRAVTGRKIVAALSRWDKNPFVRNQIINFLNKKNE